MNYITPQQEHERWEILTPGQPIPPYLGGIYRLEGITLAQLRELVAKGYLNLYNQHNDSPQTDEILDFMGNRPHLNAGIIVWAPHRRDVDTLDGGIVIEELNSTSMEQQHIRELIQFGKDNGANEISSRRIWWD